MPSLFRPPGRIGAALGVLALVSSCGDSQLGVIEPNPPAPPPPSLRVEPSEVMSNGHDPVAFRTFLDGVPVAASSIRWTIADSSLGRISSAGVLDPCFGSGETTVRADLAGAIGAHATLRMALPAFALASIQSIRSDADGRPADLGGIVGTVLAQVQTPELNCRPVTGIRLRVAGPGVDSLLAETRYVPARASVAGLALTWATAALLKDSTAAVPDGEYAIRAQVRYRNGNTAESPPVTLRVRNP
jgi:hypothetical protein